MPNSVSRRSAMGLARETTPGTPVASALWTPTKSSFKNIKKRIYVDEERMTRDGNNDVVDSIRYATGNAKGAWYNDSSVYWLLAFMGTDTATQPNAGAAPTCYSHALALADTPPTLTVLKAYDPIAYQLANVAVEKVKFSFSADNKLLEIDTTFTSKYGTKYLTAYTPTFTTVRPYAGYSPVIQLSSVQSNDILEMNIEIDQKIRVFHTASGSPDLATIYYGERTAKIDFMARFDNDALYQKYFQNVTADDSLNVVFTGANIASTYNQSFTLNFPIIGYETMEHDVSKENVMVKVTAVARPSATPNSLFTATVQNTIASY